MADATGTSGKKITLRVLTSQGLAVADEAVSIRAPGGLGSFGVLRNHASMVSTLTPGKLAWRRPDGTERSLRIGEGIFEITKNRCTILTASVKEEGVASAG